MESITLTFCGVEVKAIGFETSLSDTCEISVFLTYHEAAKLLPKSLHHRPDVLQSVDSSELIIEDCRHRLFARLATLQEVCLVASLDELPVWLRETFHSRNPAVRRAVFQLLPYCDESGVMRWFYAEDYRLGIPC